MNPWWECWPERLDDEIEGFRQFGLTFEVDDDERRAGRMVLFGRFRLTSNREVALRVVYPDTFPDTRFTVYASETSDRLARHQNPFERNLCLFPRASNAWRPSMRAAVEIAARIDLLFGEENLTPQLEDQQGEPLTAFLPSLPSVGVLVPEEAFEIPVEHGRFRLLMDDDAWVEALRAPELRPRPSGKLLLAEVLDPSGRTVFRADERLSRLFGKTSLLGAWKRLAGDFNATNFEQVVVGIRAQQAKIDHQHRRVVRDLHLAAGAVLVNEEVGYGQRGVTWAFGVGGGAQKSGPGIFVPIRAYRYGPRSRTARIPALSALGEKTVSIVGLGSLGSPLAQEFARAQVRELRIADFDEVDPATGVRWLTELEDAGAKKTSAVRAFARRNYPYTNVREFDLIVGDAPRAPSGGGDSERVVLEKLLAGASLVVDATGEDNVSRVLARVAGESGVPQLFVYSVEGFGGVVARVIPGKTGCFHCLSLHLSPEEGGAFTPPPAPADPERARFQPVGCADPTFTAEYSSLAPLVHHAARMAFGTLCGGSGYSDYADDVFVLSLREPSGTLVTPLWRSYRLVPHPKCTACAGSRSSSTLSA